MEQQKRKSAGEAAVEAGATITPAMKEKFATFQKRMSHVPKTLESLSRPKVLTMPDIARPEPKVRRWYHASWARIVAPFVALAALISALAVLTDIGKSLIDSIFSR